MSFLHLPELAADRVAQHHRDAAAWRRARPAATDRRSPGAIVRRRAALGFLAIHRLAAAAARRLDACLTEDLVGPRVATDGI